jgi:sulfite dehydrogenase
LRRARHRPEGDHPDQPFYRALIHHQRGGWRKAEAGSNDAEGHCLDGGKGIKEVAVSTDGGKTWMPAKLGKELGKYSFREWKLPVKLEAGAHELKVRATNNAGDVQPMDPLWNPAGYLRNVVETVRVTAA